MQFKAGFRRFSHCARYLRQWNAVNRGQSVLERQWLKSELSAVNLWFCLVIRCEKEGIQRIRYMLYNLIKLSIKVDKNR